MNLILFESDEVGRPLARLDPRARHIQEVLRREPGDEFDAGIVNGPRGKGRLVSVGESELRLDFSWGPEPPALGMLEVIGGLPRPQTARRLLQVAATLGVSHLSFFGADKGEPGYGQSTLWSSGEWQRHLRDGAAQAFDTRLPVVEWRHGSLIEALRARPEGVWCLALDNYEAGTALTAKAVIQEGATRLGARIALGPERGWSGRERDWLRAEGFRLMHLGPRVLRTESALVAAVMLLRSAWEFETD